MSLSVADLGFVGQHHGPGFHGLGPHSLVGPHPRGGPVLHTLHEPVLAHPLPVHQEPAPYHPPPSYHEPVAYHDHHDPHHHVPGFLKIQYGDHGHSDVQYDYGYGHRNYLHIPVGHHHHGGFTPY